MEPRAYLTELGYSKEDIDAMLADEKQTKLITAAAKSYSEGRTLKQQADAEKEDTARYWEEQTEKLQGSVTKLTAAEKRAAAAEAESARRSAYLKSLADQGYDVPKEMYEGAVADPAKNTPDQKYVSRADLQREIESSAPTLIALQSLSNEYFDLYGKPYLTGEADFAEARKAGKSMRDFVRQKYGFDAKVKERETNALKSQWEAEQAEKLKAKEAELAAKYGNNPDTRVPVPSKFDRVTSQPGFQSDSWKSEESRKANQANRLKKFANVPLNRVQ